MSTAKEVLTAELARQGLTIVAQFVPFSRSRNAKPPKGEKKAWLSLNWRITCYRNGRAILETDYSAGSGHCPASKLKDSAFIHARESLPVARANAIRHEIETGKTYKRASWAGVVSGPAIEPDACDVWHSLALDSDVLDAGGFESWASNLGYDTDSREAEKTYTQCLETALKLRGAGVDLDALREASQDY